MPSQTGGSQWLPAAIVRMQDDRYELEYENTEMGSAWISLREETCKMRHCRDFDWCKGVQLAELKAGSVVEARFEHKNGKKAWLKGVVECVALDGTHAIRFEDGQTEQGVLRQNVRTQADRVNSFKHLASSAKGIHDAISTSKEGQRYAGKATAAASAGSRLPSRQNSTACSGKSEEGAIAATAPTSATGIDTSHVSTPSNNPALSGTGQSSKGMVGLKVTVVRKTSASSTSVDGRAWCAGEVINESAERGYLILYNDGETSWEDTDDVVFCAPDADAANPAQDTLKTRGKCALVVEEKF